MELQEIEIFIEKDGQVRIEVRGVKGDFCLAATKDLEKALGGQIAARDMTAEMNEPRQEETPERQQERSGE